MKEVIVLAIRAINNNVGHGWGDGMSPKVLWDVVRAAAAGGEMGLYERE